MDKKTFDEGLKLLKRFLKDKGLYRSIFINYLFKDGRPIENLFDEFNTKRWNDVDNWELLFYRVNLLVGENNINNFNIGKWYELIHDNGVDAQWKEYYKNNTK